MKQIPVADRELEAGVGDVAGLQDTACKHGVVQPKQAQDDTAGRRTEPRRP